jgi:hypothetical protein
VFFWEIPYLLVKRKVKTTLCARCGSVSCRKICLSTWLGLPSRGEVLNSPVRVSSCVCVCVCVCA